MTENRKNAYRYLLYHFLLEARTTPTPPNAGWDANQTQAHSYYVGAVAYQLHNLALAAATNFKDFEEQGFWAGLQQFSVNNPTILLGHYRRIFDEYLADVA